MPNSSPPWIRASEFTVSVNNIPVTPAGNTTVFKTGQQIVAAAGVPVQLSATSVAVKAGTKLTVIAKPSNAGTIYFANTQALCIAGIYFNGLLPGLAHSFAVQDAQNVWLDASNSGDGVSWYCEQ